MIIDIYNDEAVLLDDQANPIGPLTFATDQILENLAKAYDLEGKKILRRVSRRLTVKEIDDMQKNPKIKDFPAVFLNVGPEIYNTDSIPKSASLVSAQIYLYFIFNAEGVTGFEQKRSDCIRRCMRFLCAPTNDDPTIGFLPADQVWDWDPEFQERVDPDTPLQYVGQNLFLVHPYYCIRYELRVRLYNYQIEEIGHGQ